MTAIASIMLFLRRRKPTPARLLTDLERDMGDLFDTMQKDLKQSPSIREFFVVFFRGQGVLSAKPHFEYNSQHIPNLAAKVALLAAYGFVHDVTPRSVPIYRMTEPFVAYLVERSPRGSPASVPVAKTP
jgi:hypothetical protein